ncbi:ubiquitin carboxyl-terminal hydrolase 36 isoform X2 [Trichogramma pretiosum]|uniref:ubiquitin carboxyl-terminal hydrolase 36 isoform X2 n=1 Tax=Trichogramma pretiosum TaxID=7493 RepID=UPI0006C9A608|nr:ubiquitin carboxyl-terminal hydrolase 36 isoform X2 [Trichogramma pretiosum]
MPAVSVCDPLTMAIRHNIDTAGQLKSSDDLTLNLGSASRILNTEIEYVETDNCRSSMQERLKTKYMVLSLPKPEKEAESEKEGSGSSKANDKSKEPRLPEPAYTLYPVEKVNLGWKEKFPPGAGMMNVGNTCYLNSTLQALFHVPALVNWLLSDSHHQSKCDQNVKHRFHLDAGGECLTCAVAKTLQASHEKSGDSIKPVWVYSKLKLICRTMVPGQQEDAHEFLRYLLEGMEKAYLARLKATKLDSYSKETTPINQIFGGYLRTEVKCLQCRHVSTTFQHFQDLLLDIRKASTLDEALSNYFCQEQLDNNDYKCEACKRRVPACKQFILERPPKVLCVQLKRFSVLGGKISRHIGFKPSIDMGPYLRRKPGEAPRKIFYKLASMVTHMGPSVNCGHYTAVAKDATGQFYSFDDSYVRRISDNNVMSTNAYIMIFEMDPSSVLVSQQTKSGSSQVAGSKSDGTTSQLSSSVTHVNGLSSRLSDNSGAGTSSSSSSSAGSSAPSSNRCSNGINGESKNAETSSSSGKSPQQNQDRRSFIGPQLPPGMTKERLAVMSNGGGNGKLVDYEAESSEDEDYDGPVKKPLFTNGNSETNGKSNVTNGLTNGHNHSTNGDSNGVKTPPAPPQISSNGNASKSSTELELTNGHERSEMIKSPSKSGPSQANGLSNGKFAYKQHQRGEANEKVFAKASLNKGWDVSQDTPAPSSFVTANGWDRNESQSNGRSSHNHSPNAADVRNFNGTNRSDTTTQLLKSSLWGYGNTNVHSWNGGKARLDREVETQRHKERIKRRYDDEDDEIDKGRTKKVKTNHYDNNYNNKYHNSNGRDYNPFQEHQNNKWRNNQMNNGHGNYNRNSYGNYNHRSWHNGGNRQHYRNHNHNKRNQRRR